MREEVSGDNETGNPVTMEWKHVLIRSGFQILCTNSGFDFSEETPENVRFFREILRQAMPHESQNFDGVAFAPTATTVDELLWRTTIRRLRKGSEGEDFTVSVKLEFLDPCMAGVVRWLNAIGIRTTGCCDGDGRPRNIPYLQLANKSDETHLDYFIRVTTKHEWGYGNRRFRRRNPNRQNIAEDEVFDALWLLDLAEQLYHCREPFRELIQLLRESNNS